MLCKISRRVPCLLLAPAGPKQSSVVTARVLSPCARAVLCIRSCLKTDAGKGKTQLLYPKNLVVSLVNVVLLLDMGQFYQIMQRAPT